MSLYEEMQNGDPEKAAEFVRRAMLGTAPGSEILGNELARADDFPLLQGLRLGFDDLRPFLQFGSSISRERLDDMQLGLDIARIALSLYASSEVPDSPDDGFIQ